MKFTDYLTKEIGIATIPLSPFYKDGNNEKVIRLCFAKNDEVIMEAAKILSAL